MLGIAAAMRAGDLKIISLPKKTAPAFLRRGVYVWEIPIIGNPRFELGLTESESVVLPLHQSPNESCGVI